MQGRPGPVVIALPEDMLVESAEVADAPRVAPTPIWPGLAQTAELQKMLWSAERPIAILGGAGWTDRRARPSRASPSASKFRSSARFAARAPSTADNNYAGEIGLSPESEAAAASSPPTSSCSSAAACRRRPPRVTALFDIPAPRHRLVHVHADAREIGRNYHPTLGIIATSPEFCAALEGVQPPASIRWSAETRHARGDYLAWSEQAPPNPGRVQLSEIMFALRRRVPDAVFTTGAGNFAIWVGRFLRFRGIEQQLGPTSGSMGFGLPAAIGAARVFPKRTIVCFTGDGDFLMNGQEFATAVLNTISPLWSC